LARFLGSFDFRLLQQYRPKADVERHSNDVRFTGPVHRPFGDPAISLAALVLLALALMPWRSPGSSEKLWSGCCL
jgi:hypothetical protein